MIQKNFKTGKKKKIIVVICVKMTILCGVFSISINRYVLNKNQTTRK